MECEENLQMFELHMSGDNLGKLNWKLILSSRVKKDIYWPNQSFLEMACNQAKDLK